MHTNKIYLPDKEGDIGINYRRKLVQIKYIHEPLLESSYGSKISCSQNYIISDKKISTSTLILLLNLHPIIVVPKKDNKYHVIGNVRLYSIVMNRIKNNDIKVKEKIPVLILDTNDEDILRSFTLFDSFTAALLYSYGKQPFESMGALCMEMPSNHLAACFCKSAGGNTRDGSNNYISKVFNVCESTLGLDNDFNNTNLDEESHKEEIDDCDKEEGDDCDKENIHNLSSEMSGDSK